MAPRYLVAFLPMLAACARSNPSHSPRATGPTAIPESAATTSNVVAAPVAPDAAPPANRLSGKPIPFPNTTAPAFLDYMAYERANGRVWVPVGSTGSVDVLDIQAG